MLVLQKCSSDLGCEPKAKCEAPTKALEDFVRRQRQV
jgi:phage terminase small subunit